MMNSIQPSHHNDKKRTNTPLPRGHYSQLFLLLLISMVWINQYFAMQKMEDRITRLEQMSQILVMNRNEVVYPTERERDGHKKVVTSTDHARKKAFIFTGHNSMKFANDTSETRFHPKPERTLNHIINTEYSRETHDNSRSLKSHKPPSSCDGTLFVLEIDLDDSAVETSWQLHKQNTNTIIVTKSYGLDDSETKDHFETCIERGPYIFSLFDEAGNGISCNNPLGCYRISIDHEHTITGQHFKKKVEHRFDSSALCVLGEPTLVLEADIIMMHLGAAWKLKETLSDTMIELKQKIDENKNESTVNYLSCLTPGLYTLTESNLRADEISCANVNGCYRIFVNHTPISNASRSSKDFTSHFSMSNSGLVAGRQCGRRPLLSTLDGNKVFEQNSTLSKVVDSIYALSSWELLLDPNSPQYKAACWILHDDVLQPMSNLDLIVERYAFAVFLYATHQEAELFLTSSTCDYSGVTCERDGVITKIEWGSKELIGSIPSEISHLRHLDLLNLDRNRLQGTLTPAIGLLSNLKVLFLRDNRFGGTIPTQVGKLLNLERLNMQGCALTGSIPSEMGLCKNLIELRLVANNLTSTIPEEIYHCTKLNSFFLEWNNLSGTISPNIDQLLHLQELDFARNSFTGSIPLEIGNITPLKHISLWDNHFTGPIFDQLTKFHSLELFRVDSNKLTGTLPPIFEHFTKLKTFQTSNNHLSGKIPESLWNLTSVNTLELQNNHLTGGAPKDICNDYTESFEVDNSRWFLNKPKVECACCGVPPYCYLWNVKETMLRGVTPPLCPSSNIHPIIFETTYIVTEKETNASISESFPRGFFESDICFSPTGCYEVKNLDRRRGIWNSTTLSYSASAMLLRKQDKCDAVDICGKSFEPGDPKRVKINHITQLAASDLDALNNPLSPAYQALCWIMTEDPLLDDYEVCDGTLLQRFVLVLFTYSYGKSDEFQKFASQPTCDWPGTTCDSENMFVEHLRISRKNLQGTLITEIGLLTRLQTIDLSENKLSGRISPQIFINLPNLQEFNVGYNELGGQLPENVYQISQLKTLNVTNNLLVGTLPDDILYSKNLEIFDISNNMFQGGLPQALTKCENLKHIDLSKNSFEGVILPQLGNLKGLEVMKLNENKLAGSLPFQMFDATNMRILMIQANELSGSIPTEIGNLKNASVIAMNHNFLKGTIPMELGNIQSIESIHLQSNFLTGTAPEIVSQTKNAQGYITDCGDPSYKLQSPLICPSCTVCCNSDKLCQENIVWDFPIWLTALVASLILPVIIISMAFGLFYMHSFGVIVLPFIDRSAVFIYNDDSVYSFIFSRSWIAKAIYAGTMIIQIMIFVVFLQASNFSSDDTAWQYSIRCPRNKIDCEDESSVNAFGWFLFVVVTALNLGVDFVNSILQLQKAVALRDGRLFTSGFILLSLTTLASFTSGVYNVALAESNTDLIVNAVILLFINDLDEKILAVLKCLAPDWTNDVCDEIDFSLSDRGRHRK